MVCLILNMTGCKEQTILLDEASVTATENTIMAAVLAKGQRHIRNAASEPHIQELCEMLNAMGAEVHNIGSNTLVIEGKESLLELNLPSDLITWK